MFQAPPLLRLPDCVLFVSLPSVPPKYVDLSGMIEFDSLRPAHTHHPPHASFLVPNLDRTSLGKSRFATPTHRSAPVRTEATPVDASGSNLLGLAPAPLGRLVIGPADRETRNGGGLASQGISPLLDTEDPARPAGSPPRSPKRDECASGVGATPVLRRKMSATGPGGVAGAAMGGMY